MGNKVHKFVDDLLNDMRPSEQTELLRVLEYLIANEDYGGYIWDVVGPYFVHEENQTSIYKNFGIYTQYQDYLKNKKQFKNTRGVLTSILRKLLKNIGKPGTLYFDVCICCAQLNCDRLLQLFIYTEGFNASLVLWAAAASDAIDVVKLLLKSGGVDDTDIFTSVLVATQTGHIDIVKYILSVGKHHIENIMKYYKIATDHNQEEVKTLLENKYKVVGNGIRVRATRSTKPSEIPQNKINIIGTDLLQTN